MAKKIKKEDLETLYECWKDAETYKERIILVEERLPKVSSILALKLMRQLANTDPKWIGWSTRKKNQDSKNKEQKEAVAKKSFEEREHRKKERELRRKEKSKRVSDKDSKVKITKALPHLSVDDISPTIPPKFFFCKAMEQYANTMSCIFRVFSEDSSFILGSPCVKCRLMDKHIPQLEDIINARKTKNGCREDSGQRHKRNKAG